MHASKMIDNFPLEIKFHCSDEYKVYMLYPGNGKQGPVHAQIKLINLERRIVPVIPHIVLL